MKKRHFGKAWIVVFSIILIMTWMVGCGTASNDSGTGGGNQSISENNESGGVSGAEDTQNQERTYYYVAPYMGHPYIYDVFLGFRYAADEFGVKIIQSGPDGFDTQAATEAFEQAIAKKPDGIVTIMWDGSLTAAAKSAIEQGIPVIVMEAAPNDHGALTYIGLDNYQCGVDTAKELVNVAGNSGKVVLQGNWGASNTDAKLAGVKDFLADTGWEIIAEVDDQTDAQKAIEVAKGAINNHPDVTAFIGLNSASGPGIAEAMEELNIDPSNIYIVCNDREDMTLEYISDGYIDATLCNKTAMSAYLAISLFEDYWRFGLKDAPVSANNEAANLNIFPTVVTTGTFSITKDNVEEFRHENMDTYETDLYVQ